MIIKKKFLASSICLIIVLIIALYKNTDIQGTQTQNEGNTIGPVTVNTPVEQTFVSEQNGLTKIDLFLATYARTNTSNIYFTISDQHGESVFSKTVNASAIRDNSFFSLDFDTINNSKGKIYTIKITSDAQANDNAITAWASNSDLYTSGNLYLNGSAANFDITFRIFYSENILSKKLIIYAITAFIAHIAVFIAYSLFLSKKSKKTAIVCWILCALSMASGLTAFYNKFFLHLIAGSSVFTASGLLRTLLFFAPSLLYTSFLFFDNKKIGDFVFSKRWIIAGVIFVITVACDLNLSSVSRWNAFVQPNIYSEFSEPIIGTARHIRSDEWLVTTPWRATGELVGYGDTNNIVRGTYNTGMAASGLYLSYSALANPINWGYYLLGFEYGTSFYWMSLLIVGFMSAFELCYILTKGKRLYALFGAVVFNLSQFAAWWSLSVLWSTVPAIIICIYYYCEAKTKHHKILLALAVVFSCSTFITNLYPAWQVPLAYLLIAVVVWIVIEKWPTIKNFKKFDWLTVAGAFAFLISIVGSYLYDNRFYTENVMNTIYPGHRIRTGGWSLNKAFYYPQTLLFPFKDLGNPSEAGVIFCVFPIPFVIALSNLICQLIRNKKDKNVKIDILNIPLLILAAFIAIYCTSGLPEWLAKITLMTYSTAPRAVDVLVYICALLMIRNLAVSKKERLSFPVWAVLAISSAVAIYSIYITNKSYPNYMPIEYVVFITVCILSLSFALFNAIPIKTKNIIIATGTIGIALCGLAVNPVTRGVEALKSKPAALAIQEIVKNDPDAKWAAFDPRPSFCMGQYVIANGGSCIDSVNYIPNMELWTILDPEGKYNEVYNRYARVTLSLTNDETSFELLHTDTVLLYLNYSDMKKCEIDYIASSGSMTEDSDLVDFELLYNEDGYYIYRVLYL